MFGSTVLQILQSRTCDGTTLTEIRVYPKLVCNFGQSSISGPDQNRLIEDCTAYELKIGDADSSSAQLPLIGDSPVEPETSGEWAPEFAQALDRFFPATVAGNLELPRAGYPHFDLVALLQLQCIDHGRG